MVARRRQYYECLLANSDNGNVASVKPLHPDYRKAFNGHALLAAMLMFAVCPAFAQHTTPGGNSGDNGGLNGSLSHEALEKLSGDHKKDTEGDTPTDPGVARATAQAQSEPLLKALQIPCMMTNARLVVSGTRQLKPGAGEVEAKVYEVACSGGMGYLLQTQGMDAPLGNSCLNAEESRAADVAKGKSPSYFCALPENRDVYALVSGLISSNGGATCSVGELQWFGHSASTRTDYSEVKCKEGGGYLVQVPQPGSSTPTTVMTCTQAAKLGIKCRLTDAGPIAAPITLDTLKSALAEHGVGCKIDRIRLIGHEENRKRYVVEYQCADQPTSMVAFLPLEGNTNPYDVIDCAKAVHSGIICSYSE
jgi:hypothetical protein